jgi:hypothetical protein
MHQLIMSLIDAIRPICAWNFGYVLDGRRYPTAAHPTVADVLPASTNGGIRARRRGSHRRTVTPTRPAGKARRIRAASRDGTPRPSSRTGSRSPPLKLYRPRARRIAESTPAPSPANGSASGVWKSEGSSLISATVRTTLERLTTPRKTLSASTTGMRR